MNKQLFNEEQSVRNAKYRHCKNLQRRCDNLLDREDTRLFAQAARICRLGELRELGKKKLAIAENAMIQLDRKANHILFLQGVQLDLDKIKFAERENHFKKMK